MAGRTGAGVPRRGSHVAKVWRLMFVYLWEYVVLPRHKADFERAYGAEGAWVELFSRAAGYVDTSLVRDRADPNRFVTIDRWESSEAHSAFLESFRAEFDELDARCEDLTESETLIGHFESAGRPSNKE